MTRTTAALFIAASESVFFTLICSFAISGVLSQTQQDYTGLTRGILSAQFSLILLTMLALLFISSLEKTRFLLKKEDETTEEEKQRQNKINYEYTLGICNAYGSICFMLCAALILYFNQAVTFNFQIDNSQKRLVNSYESTQRLDWVQAVAGASGWSKVCSMSAASVLSCMCQ